MEATTARKPSGSTGTGVATAIREDNTSSLQHVAAALAERGHPGSLSTHPLVSALSAAFVLGILYLPQCLLSLLLHPPVVSALLLLATLFCFGSSSRPDHHPETCRSPRQLQPLLCPEEDQLQLRQEKQPQVQILSLTSTATTPEAEPVSSATVLCSTHKPLLLPEHPYFVEWPRWGPLEVIYEDYEEEIEEEDDDAVRFPASSPVWRPWRGRSLGIDDLEGIVPFSYSDIDYSDDDSASSSGGGFSPAWELPEDLFPRWEAEEEGLIEIPLEEDNLIEIDISACQ